MISSYILRHVLPGFRHVGIGQVLIVGCYLLLFIVSYRILLSYVHISVQANVTIQKTVNHTRSKNTFLNMY